MAQAITGHSSALESGSISYYSMKLTFSLQTSVFLPPGQWGMEGGTVKRERELGVKWEKGESIGTLIRSKSNANPESLVFKVASVS